MSSYFDQFYKSFLDGGTSSTGDKMEQQPELTKNTERPDELESPKNTEWEKQPEKIVVYQAQRLSYPFALAAFIFFGVQALVSNGGALEVVFPDMPSPIPFTAGRSFHLNISLYWPLIGMTGGIYYLFCREANQEIYSTKLITTNFLLMTLTLLAILGSLVLGYNDGREYLEAIRPLKAAMVAACVLLLYNVTHTYRLRQIPGTRATLVSILIGIFSLIIFYLPNLIKFTHPTVDELVKFWVVHMWEEMCLELIGIGVQTSLLLAITGANRRVMEGLLYLDMALIALAGILATGHHYYWVGVPAVWLWIGGVFSAIQVIPAFLLFYSSLKTANKNILDGVGQREKITLALVACSVFYHIFGAGLFGFAMAYPALNRYVHGTYMTSAHSHLALFGVLGFLTLAVCFYILLSEINLSKADYRRCWLSIAAVNVGLLVMGVALTLAGGLQAYLLRVVGLTITEVNELIRPYLLLRLVGGLTYTVGSLLFTWVIVKNVYRHRNLLFTNDDAATERRTLMRKVGNDYGQLIIQLKQARVLVTRMQSANRRRTVRLRSIIDKVKNKTE